MPIIKKFKKGLYQYPNYFKVTEPDISVGDSDVKKIVPYRGVIQTQGDVISADEHNEIQKNGTPFVRVEISTIYGVGVDAYIIKDFLNEQGLFNGLKMKFKVPTTNTNNTTVLVIDEKQYILKKPTETEYIGITAGDLKNNEIVEVVYSDGVFVLVNVINKASETEAGLITLAKIKETVRENAPSLESYENIVNTHAKKNIYTEEGIHGLRYYDNVLQVRKLEGDENLGEIEVNGEVEWEKVELGDPWETNLEKLMGMPYGGTIQGASSKEAGKFYYDTSTKEYYECTENNALNYVESSKYRSMSRKNVGKGEIEAWDTTKNSKLYQKDINSPAYSAYDVGSFEIGNFIIKFGRTSSSIATQYFPTPFPNKCISVVLTPLRRVDIYVNIDVYSYNNQKFTYVGELHKINGICWIAIGY